MSDLDLLLSKLSEIEQNAKAGLYKKKKPAEVEHIAKPKEFPIVQIICTRCNTKYQGRAISFKVAEKRYIPQCLKCIDVELWWLHYYVSEVEEIKQ